MTQPIVANLLHLVVVGLNLALAMFVVQKQNWFWLAYVNFGIGILVFMLMWCVQCSDPGVINRDQDKSKLPLLTEEDVPNWDADSEEMLDLEDENLSLNSYEMQMLNDTDEDPVYDRKKIFRKCRFYKYRRCETCNIQRLPKANHCSVCNNCVKGFDHHCTLLNNCVGKRNLRTFLLLLMTATLFYLLTGIIGVVAVIYLPIKDAEDTVDPFGYDSIASIILISIQVFKFIFNCCCTSCMSFGTQIVWILVEFVIVLALGISQLNLRAGIGSPLISLGFSFFLVVWPLLRKHLDFIMHHLTEKEFHARMETAK